MSLQSGYPRHISYGTEDQSARKLPLVPKQVAQFRPLLMLDTQKGDYRDHIVTGGELLELFGSKTLDVSSKYFNHQSMAALQVLATGATATVRRMRGDPEKTSIAEITYYMLTTTELQAGKIFQRDLLTGKVLYDNEGNILYGDDNMSFNNVVIVASSSDALSGTTITLSDVEYTVRKLFTIPAEGHGEFYNNIGVSIQPLIGEETDTTLQEAGMLGYRIRCYDKSSGIKGIIKTVLQESEVKFTFGKMDTHPTTNEGIVFTDLFPEVYGNYTNPQLPVLQPYTFDRVQGYSTDFESPVKLIEATLADAETAYYNKYTPTWADIQPVEIDDAYVYQSSDFAKMANFITLQTTSEVEYETLRAPMLSNDDITAIKLTLKGVPTVNSIDVPVYLKGGLDADMTVAEYEAEVAANMSPYMDRYSSVINTATNKDTFLIDSGFSLDVKKQLIKYTGVRRDNFVLLSTYVWNVDNKPQTWAEANSVAALLNLVAGLYPESTAFGTSVARVAILIGSGPLSSGGYRYDMPLTVDWVRKLAYFAKGSVWDKNKGFSRQPGSLTDAIYNIEPKGIPANGEQLWKNGAFWTEPEDTVVNYYPGQQTAHPDDTSVLNAITTAVAVGYTARNNDDAYRAFGGVTDLTNSELLTAVNGYMKTKLDGAFAGIVLPTAKTVITDYDKLVGYSWHLEVELAASNMKTVMHSKIITVRKDG